MKNWVLLGVAAVALCGCTLFDRQEKRINYTESLNSNYPPSMVTDAKQRVVTVTKANVGVGDDSLAPDGKGGWVKVPGKTTSDAVVKNHPSNIICAEPSPDVAQAISAAFTAAAQVDAKMAAAPAAGAATGSTQQISGSGSVGSAYASSIAQLGERLATVQLLRDKMYRACEAYQNGAISDTSYTLMLSRFDKTMTSLLSSEMAAGAFGRNLAALGGSASTRGVDPKAMADAKAAAKTAADGLKTAAAMPATDEKTTAARDQAVKDAGAKLDDAVSNLADLELQAASTAAQSGPPAGAGGVFGQIVGRGALDGDVVARINANFLDDDASGSIIDACVTALDRVRLAGGISPALQAQIDAAAKAVGEKAAAAREEEERTKGTVTPEAAISSTPSPARVELAKAQAQLQALNEVALGPSLSGSCDTILKTADAATVVSTRSVAADGTTTTSTTVTGGGLLGLLQANKATLRSEESKAAQIEAMADTAKANADKAKADAAKAASDVRSKALDGCVLIAGPNPDAAARQALAECQKKAIGS